MPHGWIGRNQRRAPRIDVLMRVKGELVTLDTPIVVHDLSRTGFAVLSETAFQPGETLDFRLVSPEGRAVRVTARAVHSRRMPAASRMHLSGFMFIPGVLTGRVPQVLIDELIESLSVPAPCF